LLFIESINGIKIYKAIVGRQCYLSFNGIKIYKAIVGRQCYLSFFYQSKVPISIPFLLNKYSFGYLKKEIYLALPLAFPRTLH